MKLKKMRCGVHGNDFVAGLCETCKAIVKDIHRQAHKSSKQPVRVPPEPTQDRIELLAQVLLRGRWDDQGGFVGYMGDGDWNCSGIGVTVTDKEVNELMALAGVVPDKIESRGSCQNCSWAKEGKDGKRYERGYSPPCSGCKRPYHSHFHPLKEAKRKK